MTLVSTEKLLEKYKNNLTDSDILLEVNLHLHNSIDTQTVQQQKITLVKIFDFLEAQHIFNDAEMHAYLHNNFDPLLTQTVQQQKIRQAFI